MEPSMELWIHQNICYILLYLHVMFGIIAQIPGAFSIEAAGFPQAITSKSLAYIIIIYPVYHSSSQWEKLVDNDLKKTAKFTAMHKYLGM